MQGPDGTTPVGSSFTAGHADHRETGKSAAWRNNMKRPKLGCLLLALLGPQFALAQIKLPPTPVREVSEEFFGTKVTDPYRWLENTSDPEVIAWLKTQNDYTREALSKIPGRPQVLDVAS